MRRRALSDLNEFGLRLAPPGAYSILVSESNAWTGSVSGKRYGWKIESVRLYGKDIWEDYERTHILMANNWWGSVTPVFETREEALAAGVEIAAEHRLLHAYWVPKE